MKPLVLFGTGKIAEVLLHFFREASNRTVVACTTDRDYLPGPRWNDLPCVAFEDVEQHYPPEEHDMFVALGYQDLNDLRAARVKSASTKGYQLISYVHPDSGIPSDCHMGDNCFVMNNVMIHPRVTLGNNVFVWSGSMVGHHTSIGDHCWLTSSTNISGVVSVGHNCFFAVNSTVAHGVSVGNECFIGANALITKDAHDGQVFMVENTKAFRLNSRQFLRMSTFANL